MKLEFPGIILSDKLFSKEDLEGYCNEKLSQDLPEWEHDIYRFMKDFLDERDYIEQETSGTTGAPKVLKLSKQSLIESAKRTGKILNLKFGDKALLCLPIKYIAGKMMVVRSFVTGLDLFWEEPSAMPLLTKYGKIDFCAMVPLQVYNSFSSYEFINNIHNLLIGGAELRPELLTMFSDVNNNTFETYGMAETCSHVALRRLNGRNPDMYFHALPGIRLDVDHRGCLKIEADYIDHIVQTNDVVALIDHKRFVWKGRIDNLINSGGIKIKPEELEAEIANVLEADFVIVGMPDAVLGQAITLVVESETEVDFEALKHSLRTYIPSKQIPKKYFCVDELPRNASFKVDRKKLLEILEEKGQAQ